MDLASFSELQDWAIAADNFVQDGNPERLAILTNKRLRPLLKEKKGKDEVANNLREINKHIQKLVPLIQTNRGKDIWKFPYDKLQLELKQFSTEQSYIKPLNAVIDQIQQKVSGFKQAGTLQWLEGVNWCIQHRLIQQGITQLQEGLLSWLCIYFENQAIAPVDFFDLEQKDPRNLLSSAINFIKEAPEKHKWKGPAGKYKEITQKVMMDPLAKEISTVYNDLTNIRNDINHGGYTNAKSAQKFYDELKKHYESIYNKLHQHNISSPTPPQGLVNLSNHPSTYWPSKQLKKAKQTYGKIIDISFPPIPPEANQHEIKNIVNEYYYKIRKLRPKAVHLMGEMTFTYSLISELKKANIECIASTTHRRVEEKEGKKIVQFQFIQFRNY